MRPILATTCALVIVLLAGCGKPAAPDPIATKRGIQQAWEAAANPFVVAGWTSGDRASWQEQMNRRAQNQNEFLRTR